MTSPDPPAPSRPSRRLSLFDATSIIVGIVIGAGLYETAPIVARNVPGPAWLAGVWIAGGLIALLGAATYAELATTYREPGGEFAYLCRAYGSRLGFVFAWSQLWVVRPGSIGAMALIFGNYFREVVPCPAVGHLELLYALLAILVLSIICGAGIRPGAWTQNVLTAAKVIGLLLIAAVAFSAPGAPATRPAVAAGAAGQGDLRLALILVLFTYGGWNDMAYVAAEVRRPRRNLVRALLLGTATVTAIYVAVNGAFLHVLGIEGVRQSRAVAAETVRVGLGAGADRAISLLICLSCLGAIHGMLLTGSRIYYAMGRRYPLFATLGTWDRQSGTPAAALVLQTAITLTVVALFGLSEKSFQRMVVFTTPIFWFFFLLTAVSLFVLRSGRTPRSEFRVVGYPLTPALFCLACLMMLVESLHYALEHRAGEAAWSLLLLAIGCLLSGTRAARTARPGEANA